MKDIEIVSNNKLICYSKEYYLYSRGTRIYVSKGLKGQAKNIGSLPDSSMKKVLSSVRLLARGLRLEPRCGIFVDEKNALVSYHGSIYRIDCESGLIELEHRFRPEMNNPLCFTRIQDVAGFTDGIYYGEYFLNHAGSEVNIYKRMADCSWQVVYTFSAGKIYHIHGIIPVNNKGCVYVLTGDKDNESGIFECHDDFKQVKQLAGGSQSYRACVALPVEGGMLYTTDTPLEQNFLYHIDFATGELTEVMPIAGPSIYGKVLSDTEMVFSTSVEPDSRLTGLKYEFSRKLGPGVTDRNTHLYYVKAEDGAYNCQEIFNATKDILPMGAGQFGTMMFPAGEGELLVTCQAVRKYDNKTLLINNFRGNN